MTATPPTSPAERRSHPRQAATSRAEVFHEPSQRRFPARCANLSRGGALMYIPVKTPVQPGQSVRVTLGDIPYPDLTDLAGGPRPATIVRVDRRAVLAGGHLAIAVQFAQA